MAGTRIGRQASEIIARLAAIDCENPVLDRGRAEAALAQHLRALGLDPLPVRWAEDAEGGCSAAGSAAESAAESAAIDRCVAIWLPFVDASEAGLWLFWVLEREVIAVPRPSLRISDDQLHCDDG